MSAERRYEWIDTLKGVAIFLVVVGHVLHGFNQTNIWESQYIKQGVFLEDVIYVFHMPLFFLLSGYTFGLAYIKENGTVKKRYKRQVANLIFLYFIYSFVYGVIKIISSRWVNSEIDWSDICFIPLKAIDLYWYIYILVFLYLIAKFYIERNIMMQKSILVGAVIMQILYVGIGISSYFTIVKVIYYLPFFLLGIMYQMNQIYVKDIYSIIMGVLSIAWWIFNRYMVTESVRFYDEISQLAIALFVSNMVFVIFNKYRICYRMFQYCGKHSLEIYLLHIFLTSGSRVIYTRIGFINYWIAVGLSTVLGMGIPLFISKWLRRCNLWIYFFKPIKLKNE